MSKTTVLTPKLRLDADWWQDGDDLCWLCDDELSKLFALEDAEAIQVEVSTSRRAGGYVFWFGCEARQYGMCRWVRWGTTEASVQFGGGNVFLDRVDDWLLDDFTITSTPTKLYVRIWLLTGKDAKDD